MKANEPGFRNLVKLAMKFRVSCDGNTLARCLVCGWETPPGLAGIPHQGGYFWLMESHIKDHIERDEITEQDFVSKV